MHRYISLVDQFQGPHVAAKSVSVLLCQPRLIIVSLEVGFTGCVFVSAGSGFTAAVIDEAVKEKDVVLVGYLLDVAAFIVFPHRLVNV